MKTKKTHKLLNKKSHKLINKKSQKSHKSINKKSQKSHKSLNKKSQKSLNKKPKIKKHIGGQQTEQQTIKTLLAKMGINNSSKLNEEEIAKIQHEITKLETDNTRYNDIIYNLQLAIQNLADTKSTNKQTENKITKQEQQAMEGIMGSMQLYSTLKKNNEDKISKLRSVIVISS